MFDRHTGKVMFDMVAKFLNVLCPDWRIRLIGVASDGARNMTGRVAGVVTRLASAMHVNCPLTWIWCGAHQLDLVMEYIMSNVVKERFFGIMTAFITHLTRQLNLIAEMKTTCPRIVNRWLSTAKVTKLLKIHRPQLLAHIASKHPASAPSRLWWVSLLAMQHFTNCTSITFCSIQGLTTLLEQQQAALNDLVSLLKEDVGVTGPLTAESSEDLDASIYAIDGAYVVPLSSVHEFLSGLASWIDTLIDEASDADRNNMFNDIGRVYVTACNRIDSICVHRNDNNDRFDDPTLLPPVLPHEVVKLSASQFLRKIRKDTFRLDHRYSACQIDLIADEQKALRYAYRTEPMLKDTIDKLSGRSFLRKDGMQLLEIDFII
jgi:branched-subunit amino acid transport protein